MCVCRRQGLPQRHCNVLQTITTWEWWRGAGPYCLRWTTGCVCVWGKDVPTSASLFLLTLCSQVEQQYIFQRDHAAVEAMGRSWGDKSLTSLPEGKEFQKCIGIRAEKRQKEGAEPVSFEARPRFVRVDYRGGQAGLALWRLPARVYGLIPVPLSW